MARLAGEDLNKTSDSASSERVGFDFQPRVSYPFLTFLASGGHTSLLLSTDYGCHTVLGGTLDDALGEAFDKAARMLALPLSMSGGAAVEAAATRARDRAREREKNQNGKEKIEFLVPMRNRRDCDLSYAGLKTVMRTAVRAARREHGLEVNATNAPANSRIAIREEDTVSLPPEETEDLCLAFQDAALSHAEDRILRAVETCHRLKIPLSALVVSGGVAANQDLRNRLARGMHRLQQLRQARQARKASSLSSSSTPSNSGKSREKEEQQPLRVVFPPPRLCTDNGVMVAWAGIEMFSRGYSNSVEEALAQLPAELKRSHPFVTPRWPVGRLAHDDPENHVVYPINSGASGNGNLKTVTTADLCETMEQVKNSNFR